MWYLNPDRKFSPATLLWSNPENNRETKEPWSRNFIYLRPFIFTSVVLCYSTVYMTKVCWLVSKKGKTKIPIFVEILRLVENKATTKIRYARSICNFFVHPMGSIPFSSAVVVLINNAGYFAWFSCVDSVNDEFLWPQVKTILYSDCSLLRNIALHNDMVHCYSILTGL